MIAEAAADRRPPEVAAVGRSTAVVAAEAAVGSRIAAVAAAGIAAEAAAHTIK